LTDAELLKLFQSKFAPLQATFHSIIPSAIEPTAPSYFEDVYETAAIIPHEEMIASLLAIWERHGLTELTALAPELRKMAKELRMQDMSEQKVSDFIYAMY
jgi:hypothetical protein